MDLIHQLVQTVEMVHLLEELEWNLVLLQIKIAVAEMADTVFTASAEAAEAAETTELVQVLTVVETVDLVYLTHLMEEALLQELTAQAVAEAVVQTALLLA